MRQETFEHNVSPVQHLSSLIYKKIQYFYSAFQPGCKVNSILRKNSTFLYPFFRLTKPPLSSLSQGLNFNCHVHDRNSDKNKLISFNVKKKRRGRKGMSPRHQSYKLAVLFNTCMCKKNTKNQYLNKRKKKEIYIFLSKDFSNTRNKRHFFACSCFLKKRLSINGKRRAERYMKRQNFLRV